MATVTIHVDTWAAGWVDSLSLNRGSHTALKNTLTPTSSTTSCTLKKDDSFSLTKINIVQNKNGKAPNPAWTFYCSITSSYQNATWYVYFDDDGNYSHGSQMNDDLDVNVNLDRDFTLHIYVEDNDQPAITLPDDGGGDNTGGGEVGGGDVGTGFKVEIRPYFDRTHNSSKDWEYSTTGTVKVNNIIQNYSGYEFQYAKKNNKTTKYYAGESISVSSGDYIKTYYTTIESGGGGEEEEIVYSWNKLGSTKTQSFQLPFTLDDYEVGRIRFKPLTNGTIKVYTKGNYDMYGWLFYSGEGSLVNGGTGSSTLSGSYLKRNNNSGTGDNFSYTYSSAKANTTYEINIHEYSVGYCSGTLYVDFTPDVVNYTITPYASTGIDSVSGGGTVQSGSSTSITATPKNGYQFSQWVDEAATPYTDNPLYISNVTSNQSYWASAEPIEYDIEYNDAKQGTTTGTVRKTYTIETATFSLHTLTKTGYTFNGWYATSDFTGTAVTQITQGSTGKKTFYAKWTPVEYSITYNLNGGSLPTSPTPLTKYTIETATYTLPIPTLTNYEFQGWYENSGLTGTAVTQITNGSTGKKTFYAKWTPVEYSITYNLNSGSLPTDPAPLNKYTVETETYTLPTPTRTNYEFQGWYENSGLTGTAVTQLAQGSTENKTYYAKWKLKNYTISYNMNGGSGTIASHNSDGTTFTPSTTIPTKTGQAFIGWNTSSSATTAQYHPGVSASISSNLTLYAIWKPLITFKWTDNDYETHKTSQYLSDLSSTKDIPSNYHVSQAEVQRLINLIKTYCRTTITIDEKRLATLYNNIATALRNSSTPEHHSGSTAPTINTLPNVTAGNAITVDDFLKLENAFNDRKFI